MSPESEARDPSESAPPERTTVSVTKKGQATIPQRFRERHDISAPGRVRWFENDRGQLVVEPVRSIAAFRGAGESERSAADLLDAGRREDAARAEHLERLGDDEQ